MQRLHAPPIQLACAVLTAIAMSGCGATQPVPSPVTGRVTFEGKPVSDASIRFSDPQAGVDVLADIAADGRYTIITDRGDGLPEGSYRVAVIPRDKNAPLGSFTAGPETIRRDIPLKYRQPATSGLTVTVGPSATVFDVDMRSAP